MDEEMKSSLTASATWIRALYMLLFSVIYSVAEIVLVAVVIFQFLAVLVTREPNERLLEFGEDLGVFIFQIIQFQTFNSDEKPFPFGPWPYGADDMDEGHPDMTSEVDSTESALPAKKPATRKKAAPKPKPAPDQAD